MQSVATINHNTSVLIGRLHNCALQIIDNNTIQLYSLQTNKNLNLFRDVIVIGQIIDFMVKVSQIYPMDRQSKIIEYSDDIKLLYLISEDIKSQRQTEEYTILEFVLNEQIHILKIPNTYGYADGYYPVFIVTGSTINPQSQIEFTAHQIL